MDNQILARTLCETSTLRRALLSGAQLLSGTGIESSQLDVRVLLCHVLALEKSDLYLRLDEALTAQQEARFQLLLQRRARREPVAYITASKEFWSLDFTVDRSVLIPRPETELLVELALEYAKTNAANRSLKILDLGTGSGAIAVSLAKELPAAQVWAVDISADALSIAQNNAARHGVSSQISFLHGDLFAPLENSGVEFDLIVANPPYIKSALLALLAPEIRNCEPRVALDGGIDGLDYYRRILGGASRYLLGAGAILLELGADQGDAVKHLLSGTAVFGPASIYRDLAGKDRVIAAAKGNVRG